MREQGLVGITEAARLLGVHPNTLRNWADRGLVRAIKLPSGHRRFALAEIERVRRDMGMEQEEIGREN